MISLIIGILMIVWLVLRVLIALIEFFASPLFHASLSYHPWFMPSFFTIFYILFVVAAIRFCGLDKLAVLIVKTVGELAKDGVETARNWGKKADAVATTATEDAAIGILRRLYGNPDCITTTATWDGGKPPETRTYGKIAAAASAPTKSAATPNPSTAAPVAPAAASPTGATTA